MAASTSTRRRRAPEARKAALLAAAHELFSARGYEATSVNAVAKSAGVSVGTLFKYYPDKAALLEAVLDQTEASFLQAMQRADLPEAPMAARIDAMLAALFAHAQEQPAFFWALTSGTQALRGPRDASPGDAIRQYLASMIARGQAKGEAVEGPPEQLAVLAYGLVEAAMNRAFGGEAGASAQAWCETTAAAARRMLSA